MLGDIKKELLNNPDKLKEVLERFGYCNVINHGKYLSFGRDEYSSKKSIVINLRNNEFLWVQDYARNMNKDIFSYICTQKNVEFSEVLGIVKNVLNISDYYSYFSRRGIFGGFYENIRKKNSSKNIITYDNSILDCYERCGNTRFLKDNISLKTQEYFGIRYDVESQGIVIPIQNQVGQIIGVKCRKNYDDDDMKYFYLVPCQCSQTLYGYSQNYKYLVNNDIYLYESEKSTMQCHSYNIRNTVSLGSGSISNTQIRMILECNPKNIIFMHDTGYSIESIMRNIKKVKRYSRFSNVGLGYWDWEHSFYSSEKKSPSDIGKEALLDIMDNEIKMIGDDEYKEEI